MRCFIISFGVLAAITTLASRARAAPPLVSDVGYHHQESVGPAIPPPIVTGPPMTCWCWPHQRRKNCCQGKGDERKCRPIFEPECVTKGLNLDPDATNTIYPTASPTSATDTFVAADVTAPATKTGPMTVPITVTFNATRTTPAISTIKHLSAEETPAAPTPETATLAADLESAAQSNETRDEQDGEQPPGDITSANDSDNDVGVLEPPNGKMCICDHDRMGIAWCCVTLKGCKYERLSSCDPRMAGLGAFPVAGGLTATEAGSEPEPEGTGEVPPNPYRVCKCLNSRNVRCCLDVPGGMPGGVPECWTQRIHACKNKPPPPPKEGGGFPVRG